MQIDFATFMNWLNALKEENGELASFYEDRFTDQLQPAFAAWMSTDSLNNLSTPNDPFRLAEYQVPQLHAAAVLDEEAHLAITDGERYGAIGDAYVLSTLLLAVVLFFAGVCTKFGWRPAHMALLGIAVLLLVYSVQPLGALPDKSEWGLAPT